MCVCVSLQVRVKTGDIIKMKPFFWSFFLTPMVDLMAKTPSAVALNDIQKKTSPKKINNTTCK